MSISRRLDDCGGERINLTMSFTTWSEKFFRR